MPYPLRLGRRTPLAVGLGLRSTTPPPGESTVEIDLAQMALHVDDATGRLILVFADNEGRRVGVRMPSSGLNPVIQGLSRLALAHQAKAGSAAPPSRVVLAHEQVRDFQLIGWDTGEALLDLKLGSGPLRLTFGPDQFQRLREAVSDRSAVPETRN